MVRRLMAAVLVMSFVQATSAQTLRDSIDRAAKQAAAQPAADSNGGIPPGLLWTGIALLAAGGAFLIKGFTTEEDEETCVSSGGEVTCVSNRNAFLGTGAVMAGVGGTLLIIGAAKASNRTTSVTLKRGGFVVKHRLPLPGSRNSRNKSR
jgi:hypothetical protein